jgi:pyruvate formate lyase activating enzyme
MSGSVPIGGYLPVSFIDWTGHVAPVLFVCGCNFRCPYCHNADLVSMTQGKLSIEGVLSDISDRSAFLDGVVVSGGEPTIHEGLPEFLRSIRNSTGLEIKLDTNGSRPGVLGSIIGGSLVGAVSMDVKAPWCRYPQITGKDGTSVAESLDVLKRSGISFEVRTTFVPDLMSFEDLHEIQEEIGDVRWVIQCFRPGETLDPSLRDGTVPDIEEIEENFPGTIVR